MLTQGHVVGVLSAKAFRCGNGVLLVAKVISALDANIKIVRSETSSGLRFSFFAEGEVDESLDTGIRTVTGAFECSFPDVETSFVEEIEIVIPRFLSADGESHGSTMVFSSEPLLRMAIM